METADAGSSVPGEYMPRGQAAPENNTPRLRSIARNQVSKELETVTVLPGSNGKLREGLLSVSFKNSASREQRPIPHIVTEDVKSGSLHISYMPPMVADTTLELIYNGGPVMAHRCRSATAKPSASWVSVSKRDVSAGETIWACVQLRTAEGLPASSHSHPGALVATLCESSSAAPTRADSRPVILGTPTAMAQGATVFRFKETEAGKYLLCVEYDGERLPGCPVPLTVNRRSTEDTHVAAPASRPHFSVPDKVKAGDQAPIDIDCPSCGPHSTEKPSVLVSEFCPSTRAEVPGSGSRAEVTVEQGKCRALWTPTRAGFYQVDVRLPGQSAACSRIAQVVPAAVASRQVVANFGDTLYAGELAYMEVALHDQYGNACMETPSLRLHAGRKHSTTPVELQACAVPMHEEDGLHRVWACMTRAGLTRVCATVSGCRVNGIPLKCDILPGPPDYAASQLIGPGIGSLAVGSHGVVCLKVHDAFRNAVDDAAVPEDVQHWELIVQNEAGCEVPTVAVAGGLSLTAPRYFFPESPGLHTLRVRAGGRDLRVPPVHVQVYPEQRDESQDGCCERGGRFPPVGEDDMPAPAKVKSCSVTERSSSVDERPVLPLVRDRAKLRHEYKPQREPQNGQHVAGPSVPPQASLQHAAEHGNPRWPRAAEIDHAAVAAATSGRTLPPRAPKPPLPEQRVTARQQQRQGGSTQMCTQEVGRPAAAPAPYAPPASPKPPQPAMLDANVQQPMPHNTGAARVLSRSMSFPSAGQPPSGLRAHGRTKKPDKSIVTLLRGLVGMKALSPVSVSIAQLQKGAHHSRITQLFQDQAGKALQKRGIQPDWRSPAETPDGRRPFTVAVFTPEDKRMDSDDVAIALHKSGIGAPDMLCFVMDQDSWGSGGLQESHQLTDPQSYANIAALLQPKGRPNGPLPSRQLVDFFVRGSRSLQAHNGICFDAVYMNAKHVHLSALHAPGGAAPGHELHEELTPSVAAAQDLEGVQCMRTASHPGPMPSVTSEPGATAM